MYVRVCVCMCVCVCLLNIQSKCTHVHHCTYVHLQHTTLSLLHGTSSLIDILNYHLITIYNTNIYIFWNPAFSVHVLAPLIDTTCIIYSDNKKILRITVQSMNPVLNMDRSSPHTSTIRNSSSAKKIKLDKNVPNTQFQPNIADTENLGRKLPSFLGLVENPLGIESELSMLFDSDHSCNLAQDHINNRR